MIPEQPLAFPDFAYVSHLALERMMNSKLRSFREALQPFQQKEYGYALRKGADLHPFIQKIAAKDTEVARHVGTLKTAALLEIENEAVQKNEKLHHRTIILLEDIAGRQAAVTIALHGEAPGVTPRSEEPFNPLAHDGYFGGMGRYMPEKAEQHEPPLLFALRHAEGLATVMDAKAKACNFTHLAGAKAVITDLQALSSSASQEVWLASPAMQYATGMLFSKHGPEPLRNMITGSDAGQTQETIDRLGHASRLAESTSYNIVGTSRYGFPDTAGFVCYSMMASYDQLRQQFPEQLRPLSSVTAAVQGLGKIGSAALEMYLQAGCKVYVADILLDADPPEGNGEMTRLKSQIENWLASFERQYPHQIIRTSSQAVWDQKADVFSPCSTQEGVIDQAVIDRLAAGGTKLILSGANNPLKNRAVADYAQRRYGMLIVPEVVSNNGSAIAAGLEPTLLYEIAQGRASDLTSCMHDLLIPYIERSATLNIDKLVARWQEQNQGKPAEQQMSLYTTGDAVFYNGF
jgi:glutamate dehydrogenase/leucine dehydrogenase